MAMGWGAETLLPCSKQSWVGESPFYSLSGLPAFPAIAPGGNGLYVVLGLHVKPLPWPADPYLLSVEAMGYTGMPFKRKWSTQHAK